MSIEINVERLIQAAWEFEYLDEQLASARTEVRSGLDSGSTFGVLFQASGSHHDNFIDQMNTALTVGIETAREFKATLTAIARDHGATDENIREIFRDLEKNIAPERVK